MKKSDLKTGWRITTEHGNQYYVVLDTKTGVDETTCAVVGIDGNSWGGLSIQSMDDIIKVERPRRMTSVFNLNGGDNFEIVWQRQEKVELTLDEIAEKFDVPVSQLKIKK